MFTHEQDACEYVILAVCLFSVLLLFLLDESLDMHKFQKASGELQTLENCDGVLIKWSDVFFSKIKNKKNKYVWWEAQAGEREKAKEKNNVISQSLEICLSWFITPLIIRLLVRIGDGVK